MGDRIDPARGAPIERWLEASRSWVEEQLALHFASARDLPPGAERLEEAMRHAVLAGGKRFRPSLVRYTCAWLGGSDAACAAPAVAVELVHAYSLVHDDLPCMDDDDLRRGRPSCHKVFGEALALLAGDALLTRAFEVLARGEPSHALAWMRILAGAAGAGGMVGGQVLDLELSGHGPSLARVIELHARKTAALIAAAAEMGAVAADAQARERELVRHFGEALGRCFQATDDVLDVTGDERSLGKTPGKDARLSKPTLVAAVGLDGARAEARRAAGEALRAASELGADSDHGALRLVEHILERTA